MVKGIKHMDRVTDIMYSGEDNPVVSDKSCFRDVLEAMDIRSMGAVSIVDEHYRLVGIITDGDLRRLILKTQDSLPELFMKKVTSIMTKQPVTIREQTSCGDCFNLLKTKRFWVVPVVDDSHKLLGIVHLHALLEYLKI